MSNTFSISVEFCLSFKDIIIFRVVLLAEGTTNTWRILLHNDRKSPHRRIKKQRHYGSLAWHRPVIPNFQYSAGQTFCQKILCQIVAINCLKHFCIVMEPRFWEKSFYVKLTFSTAKETAFDIKWMTYSERISKIKVKSCWTIFAILLTSAVICVDRFSHENETT